MGTMVRVVEAFSRISRALERSQVAAISISSLRLHPDSRRPVHSDVLPPCLEGEVATLTPRYPVIVRKLDAMGLSYQLVVGECAELSHLTSHLDKILVEIVELSNEDIEFLSEIKSMHLEANYRLSVGKFKLLHNREATAVSV